MTDDLSEREQQIAAAWDGLRRELGSLGNSLDTAREWIGDRAFIRLSQKFDPSQLIICCCVASVGELLDMPLDPRHAPSPEDARLTRAVVKAHAAFIKDKP